jgi:hypothetical protein
MSTSRDPFDGTAALTFKDDQNNKQGLSLDMDSEDMLNFKQAIAKQIVGRLDNYIEGAPQEATFKDALRVPLGVGRDKIRDILCADLQTMGIDAQIVERGRMEEDISKEEFSSASLGDSIGLIVIHEGPIRWVNLTRQINQESINYWVEYGVPDSKVTPDFPEVGAKSFYEKGNLFWKGTDFGLELIDRLNSDDETKHAFMQQIDVRIKAHRGYYCWIISNEGQASPWSCVQSIARHLVEK